MSSSKHEIAARFKSRGGAVVTFSGTAIAGMIDEAKRARQLETGGILIGKYSSDGSSAIVEIVSRAPMDSEAGPSWFARGRRGLDHLLRKCWTEGSHYLGEWHTHPAQDPHPSSQDLRTLQKIASDPSRGCARPILAVLGGDPGKDPQLAVILGARMGAPERLSTSNCL